MATGQDPLSKFIENQMVFQNFVQQQQQFGAQQAIATRQLENAEIESFVRLAQNVKRPEELTALSDFFSGRNPEMAETFANLRTQIAPTLATQQAAAVAEGMGTLTPEQRQMLTQGAAHQGIAGASAGQLSMDDVVASLPQEAREAAVAISQGRQVTAAQREQLDQALAAHNLNIQQFAENIRQFGISSDLQRTGLAQQGELGRLSAMTSGGLLPLLLQGEQSREIAGLRQQMQGPVAPARLQALQGQIDDLERSSTQLQQFWQSQFGGEGGSMDLAGLLGAAEKAFDDVTAAKSPGERDVAIERYNMVQQLLGELGSALLERQRTFWNPIEGEAVALPGGPR